MHILSRRDRGQALVLVTLAFVVLVGFLGLALDGANGFGQRRRVSNAADAASLAAARVLIDVKSNGGLGDEINAAVEEFLVSAHNIDAANASWQASYVTREDPDTIIGPVDDLTAPPSNANGVRVDLSFTFDTFFMRLLGQRTLTVSASSTSIIGPLGTAVGADLFPIAISDSALNILLDKGRIRLDLNGKLMRNYSFLLPGEQLPEEVADVITDANYAYVNLSPVPSDELPNRDGCQNPTVDDNLTYWICNGSQHQQKISQLLPQLQSNWGSINSSLTFRERTRSTAVVPVYVQVPDGEGGIALQLAYFVAVEIEHIQSDNAVTYHLLDDYVSAGAMVGDGSGVETGVWAVNLKR